MGLGGISIPNPLSKGAPDAPDYKGAAEATAQSGRVNQISPWASSMWSSGAPGAGGAGGAGGGRDTQTMSLNGPLGDANNAMGQQFASAWGSPLDNGAQARQHAEDAIYAREASRLDPMWSQRESQYGLQLGNQGLDSGSEAYKNAMDNFGRQRNDAYSSAMRDAIMGGGQEASRQQQMDLMSRMAPLEGMSGLRNLSGMPGAPQGANYLGAAGMQGQYGLQAQQMNRDFWKDMIGGGIQAAAAF